MKSRFCAKALLCVVVCVSLAAADSIALRNGRQVQGKYVGGTPTIIGFMVGTTVEYFATADVLALIFDRNPDSPLGGVQPESAQPAPMKGSASSRKLTLQQAAARKKNRQTQAGLKQVSALAD